MQAELSPTEDERATGALAPTTLARALTDFGAHGYLFLRGIWSRDYIAELRDAFVTLVEAGRADGRSGGVAVGDRRLMLSLPVAGRFGEEALLAHPLVRQILAALLGDSLVLDSAGAVVALPGAPAQARHKDHD